jgi:hypothetical protein
MLTISVAQRRTELFLTGQMLEALVAVEFDEAPEKGVAADEEEKEDEHRLQESPLAKERVPLSSWFDSPEPCSATGTALDSPPCVKLWA